LKDLMQASAEILPRHALNQRRIQNQKSPANMIWLWGQGKNPALPLFKKLYGKTAAVITAVHLLKGIGRLSGMEVIDVPGATGFVDTNYAGKTQAAIEALQTVDAVFLHVEAPDECGHMGNLKLKKQAIEDFDRLIVGRLLSDLKKFGEYAVLALPDHPTPLAVKTHTDDPVPFAMYKTRWESKCKLPRAEEVNAYNEKAAEESGWFVSRGDELLRTFFEL
jgi:2,3-bisphosphoglycerate-independent phosphoglycerate mutase